MKTILLLLGSPNNEKGVLSSIAMDRIECACRLYMDNENMRFLCTGGFGEHFNTTDLPHAYYAKKALLAKGVKEEDFLPFVLSSNTYEDLEKAKQIIERESPDILFYCELRFPHGKSKNITSSGFKLFPHGLLCCKIEFGRERIVAACRT